MASSRPLTKRKLVPPEDAPPKRTPPLLHATQEDQRRRRVLHQSFEKLQRLDDPERCMLRSVLLHNTTRRLQKELTEEGPCMMAWFDAWNDSKPELPESTRLLRHVMTFSQEQGQDELSSDDISAALESAIDDPLPKQPLSTVPLWNFGAHAATVTGAPLIAGSITMGTPVVAKETNVPKFTTPVAMDMETLRRDLLLPISPEVNNNNMDAKPSPPPSSSSSASSPSPCFSLSSPSPSPSSSIVTSASTLANLSHDLDCMMAEYMTSCSSRAASFSLSCVYLKGEQPQSNSLVSVP